MSAKTDVHKYLLTLLSKKRVCVLGFGREGKSTYLLLRDLFPQLSILIADKNIPCGADREVMEKDPYTQTQWGEDYLQLITQSDILFKTPGISSTLAPLQTYMRNGGIVTSQTEVFFHLFHDQIVAVTGTKGKSTTASIIYQMMAFAGKPAFLIGNIGRPAFDHIEEITPDTIIVYETSSHQAESVRSSPHIGVFLNLFQEHLDYYHTMERYEAAKRNLFIYQTPADYIIYNVESSAAQRIVAQVASQKVGFSMEPTGESVIYIKNGMIIQNVKGKEISYISVSELPLVGKHNVLNIMPGIMVGNILGVPREAIMRSLSQLKPVPKRLEKVGTWKGITFYDDALATIPEATIAAIEALSSTVDTLLVGGFDRGQDFTKLAEVIKSSKIKNLIIFPTTGEKIADAMKKIRSPICIFKADTMQEAVRLAFTHTQVGKNVLLSTASASFGLFKDYEERSNQYRAAIQVYGQHSFQI